MKPLTVMTAHASAPPAEGGVAADFSAETWWLSLIKAVFIVAFLIVSVIMAIWTERRVLGRMQTRPGPKGDLREQQFAHLEIHQPHDIKDPMSLRRDHYHESVDSWLHQRSDW